MNIETVVHDSFQVAALDGAFTINAIASLTPAFSSLLQADPGLDLVLDFENVSSLDTSAIKFLGNINRKVGSKGKTLYLVNVNDTFKGRLNGSPESAGIPRLASTAELQQNSDDNMFRQYLQFAAEENGVHRLRAVCGVCGSSRVSGYLLNHLDYTWSWPKEGFFPHCTTSTGGPFDFFGTIPVVCSNCFAASIDFRNFGLAGLDGNVLHRSTFDDRTKLYLSKTTKKRKELLKECATVMGDDFFDYPRDRQSALFSYLLADSCARISAVNHNSTSMFLVGYINYLCLIFAGRERYGTLIDNCRTWLSQVISAPESYSPIQLAQSYYITFISLISLEKMNEARKTMESYLSFTNGLGSGAGENGKLSSPSFWFNRAHAIWKGEIERKSAVFSL